MNIVGVNFLWTTIWADSAVVRSECDFNRRYVARWYSRGCVNMHSAKDYIVSWRARNSMCSIIRYGELCALHWRHNERDGVSNHRRLACLISLFRLISKKKSKPALLALCEWNQPVTGEFLSQWASKAETVSLWWRHHMWQYFSNLCWP